MAPPTQSRLHELFQYDPTDGALYWKKSRGGKAVAGSRAGAKSSNGYRQLIVDCKNIYEHRAVWIYVNGYSHDGEIDHLNGDRSDNRICNLRATSKSGNMKNAKRPRSNTSGHVGVTWDGWSGKWKSQVSVKGKNISLGRYRDISDAISARHIANETYGFSKRHGCD